MSPSKTNRGTHLVAASIVGIALGASLGGCSDIYYARRDAIAPSAGDAIAANEAEETVDPWPAQSGNKNIAFDGSKMQSAVERYRTNRVIPPVNSTTSDVAAQQAQNAAPATGTQTANNTAPPPAPSAQ